MNVKIVFNLERDYRVEMIDNFGVVKSSMDINQEQLQEVMKELIDKLEVDMDYVLTLMIMKPKNMIFKFKEE